MLGRPAAEDAKGYFLIEIGSKKRDARGTLAERTKSRTEGRREKKQRLGIRFCIQTGKEIKKHDLSTPPWGCVGAGFSTQPMKL
jgi:hypothetical protein